MNTVLITQRVVVSEHGERRDALDQRWHGLLEACGLVAVPVPNRPAAAGELAGSVPHVGLLLTGGNDLLELGGDAPERDETERMLLEAALAARAPVLGVCRGMQLVVARFGGRLEPVCGHVAERQLVRFGEGAVEVNSYHRFGCRAVPAPLEPLAYAEDGVVEAVRHRELPVLGVQWHPERLSPHRGGDLELIRSLFAREAIA